MQAQLSAGDTEHLMALETLFPKDNDMWDDVIHGMQDASWSKLLC